MKTFVRVGAGPSLSGRGTVVKIRETGTTVEKTVSFLAFKKLCEKGCVVKLAFMPKEKRP